MYLKWIVILMMLLTGCIVLDTVTVCSASYLLKYKASNMTDNQTVFVAEIFYTLGPVLSEESLDINNRLSAKSESVIVAILNATSSSNDVKYYLVVSDWLINITDPGKFILKYNEAYDSAGRVYQNSTSENLALFRTNLGDFFGEVYVVSHRSLEDKGNNPISRFKYWAKSLLSKNIARNYC